jgi:hypothetical protein
MSLPARERGCQGRAAPSVEYVDRYYGDEQTVTPNNRRCWVTVPIPAG